MKGSAFPNGVSVRIVSLPTGFPTILSTTLTSSTQLTATVPTSAIAFPGSYQVYAQNQSPSDGPSNFVSFTVNVGTYPVPTLTSISPNSVIAGGLFPINITASGTNFALNALFNFNGVGQTTTVDQFSNHTLLTGTVPPSALTTPGTVQLTVSNPPPPGGPSNSLPFTITAPNPIPAITALSPSSAPAGTNATVTVTGTGFLAGAQVCIGIPTGISCNGTTSISSTQLSTSCFLPSSLSADTIHFYVVDA